MMATVVARAPQELEVEVLLVVVDVVSVLDPLLEVVLALLDEVVEDFVLEIVVLDLDVVVDTVDLDVGLNVPEIEVVVLDDAVLIVELVILDVMVVVVLEVFVVEDVLDELTEPSRIRCCSPSNMRARMSTNP